MIRVTRTEERSRTLVTVDGELAGDPIALVESCCKQAALRGKPVHLFLRDVNQVDSAGKALLRRLAADGIRLHGSGVYTGYLVQELAAGNLQGPSSNAGPPDSEAGRKPLRKE